MRSIFRAAAIAVLAHIAAAGALMATVITRAVDSTIERIAPSVKTNPVARERMPKPVVDLTADNAFIKRQMRRDRPYISPSWRMCQST